MTTADERREPSCPKCGTGPLPVARNMKSTASCPNCQCVFDDAYGKKVVRPTMTNRSAREIAEKLMKESAELLSRSTRGLKDDKVRPVICSEPQRIADLMVAAARALWEMGETDASDPLGISEIERKVVRLAEDGLCFGACIEALGNAWHVRMKREYGEEISSPAPQAIWREAAEKAEAALSAKTEECEELRALVHKAAKHWLAVEPGIPWEGAIDSAMEAACKEITALRKQVTELKKLAMEHADTMDAHNTILSGIHRIRDQVRSKRFGADMRYVADALTDLVKPQTPKT